MQMGLLKRLLKRGSKYATVGFATFLLDLGIVAILTTYTELPYTISIAIGFLVAVSINFAISYHWVYAGTARRFHHGYALFICLALGGAIFISTGTVWLVESFGFSIIVARLLLGGIVGVTNFLFNTFFNFRLL